MAEHKIYSQIGEQLYIGKLPNGLSVFIVPKRGFHKYYAFFATDYGAVDRRFKHGGNWTETPAGIAHFLEHKMFDTEYGNALVILTENGASANAFTSTDITAYHFECIDRFPDNLKTLLSFVSTPYFTAESVEKEQGIIGQEILMEEDDPDYCLYYGLMKSLFHHNPLRDTVLGTTESIAKITTETLYKCYKAFYNPSNMALCIAGNADPDEVFDIAQSILPAEPAEIPERDYGPIESPHPNAPRFSEVMEVSLPTFLAGCKTEPALDGRDAYKLELIGNLALDILAGHSSPLYSRLYGQGLVNSDFSASFDVSVNAAYSMFGGETREPERVFDEVCKEIARLSEDGPDTGLFRRTKKAAIGGNIRSLNSFEAICGNIVGGHFRGYEAFETPEILTAITENDITEFLRYRLIPDNMAISIITNK